MIGGPRNADSDQAKLPHNATFVRLGRKVWFTLEHSIRARGEGEELSNRLEKLKEQQDQIAQMNLFWMRIGSFDKRRTWNDDEWIAFLRTWQVNSSNVFMDGATAEEERLAKAFTIYFVYYSNLPNTPDLPDNAPDGFDMNKAKTDVDAKLQEFEDRLGDPLLQCNTCKTCALGRRMLRCSRCQSAYYCNIEHQKKNWKQHKKTCREITE